MNLNHTQTHFKPFVYICPEVGGALLGVVGVRWASRSVRFSSDSSGRPVAWDSFGIWDNRVEEPVLLPSSVRYGKPFPKVTE